MFNKLCILTALCAAPAVATSLRGVGGGAFPAPLSTNTTNTTQPTGVKSGCYSRGYSCWYPQDCCSGVCQSINPNLAECT